MKRLFTLLCAIMIGVAAMTPAQAFQQKPATTQHLKKDGTPDKRFKENKAPKGPLKKNGTPDMRYKANKPKPAASKKKK